MKRLAGTILASAVAATGACADLGWPRKRTDLVVAVTPCADTNFTIYFNEGSDRLTQPALQLVRETADRLKACSITHARVVGLADATGAPQANLTLSQRRALKVAEALRAQGIPAPAFEIDAAGDAGSMTSDGREDPVRRRAEVYLSVGPR